MADPAFFPTPTPLSLGDIKALTGAEPAPGADPNLTVDGVAALSEAGPSDLCFLESPRHASAARATRAAACFTTVRLVGEIAEGVASLVTPRPYLAFALAAARLYPSAMRPQRVTDRPENRGGAIIDAGATLESGVVVEPGAVVGAGAEIGAGTVIGPHAVVGRGVRIGRDCSLGAGVTVIHALVGDRVILHPGARIGQDGYGYVHSGDRHIKIPQIGRVIIQDDVEIGANATIDRGSLPDTVIGAGTKIDNQVQIGHNVVVGRGCLIAGQAGIAGSTTLGDFVVVGGQTGITGHVTVGAGAMIAGASAVHGDVPAGARWGGAPAGPIGQWLRTRARERRRARGEPARGQLARPADGEPGNG